MSARVILCTSVGALVVWTGFLTRSAPADLFTAGATTDATIAASLSPERLGARGALTITLRFTGGELGIPAPVRRSLLRFPAGLTLELTSLRTCSPVRLRARGPSGCPPRSRLGAGQALAEVRAGSQTMTEPVTLTVFLGPAHDLQPTLEVLGQGYTPFEERVLLKGTPMPARAPYGEELAIETPSIATLPLEPPASIVAFSLTIGGHAGGRQAEGRVILPSRCPAGGFPFAAEFTYADGSHGSALNTAPCPS